MRLGRAATLAGILIFGAVLFAGPRALRAADEPATPLGRKIDDFTLRSFRGSEHRLSDFSAAPVVVVAFLGVECPLAKLYGPRLESLQQQFAAQGVVFLGIDSNRQDSNTELLHYARTHGITFPLLKDPGNKVADQFGAQRTPEMFVLDRQRVIRYIGRVDDQFIIGIQRSKPQRKDLELAIEQLLAGQAVEVPLATAVGCLIGRIHEPAAEGNVTWSGQIAALAAEHCQECHRPGQVAPFPLLTYEDTVGWADMIGEVVEQRRMPPWHADPEYGDFANAMRLPDEARQMFLDWVAAGAPQGDPALAPPPREFVEGWQIPEPDQVVYIADKPFVVPAEGTVEYQWFVVDPGFEEDKWIRLVECRPGNPAVVHHVTVYFLPPNTPWDIDIGRPINFLGGFAPGKRPVNIKHFDGTARFIPAGSKFIFEMHYTPNGSVQTDRSSVAMLFAKPEEVKRQLSLVLVANRDFTIPPGAASHPVTSRFTFAEDSLLYSMSPHMHLRGNTFRFLARYPNGTSEILCDVPRFDFNWQHDYLLRTPKLLPKGTVMECLATFDNSTENPANPDPTQPVRWGDQTWEEMMIGAIAYVAKDQDFSRGVGMPIPSRNRQGGYAVLAALLSGAGLASLLAATWTVRPWSIYRLRSVS
ncbi:MAG: thioredoxin family protein [Pirellulales bacterium]|nr:thioredoxin family protein [Pirellulales bacterium]